MTFLINMTELPLRGGTARVFEGSQCGATNVSFLLLEAPPGDGSQLHSHPYEEIFVNSGKTPLRSINVHSSARIIAKWLEDWENFMTQRVMHIAELGLRVTDLPRAVAFYQRILGFATVRAYPTIVFLRVGDLDSPLGRGGHPQLLVLFDRKVKLDIALTTIDHFAFEIPLEHFQAERERLQQLGLEVSERIWRGEYAWLGARSWFLDDPDGNTIELIAHDPSAAIEVESS